MSIRNKITILFIAVFLAGIVYIFQKMSKADDQTAQDKADLSRQVALQDKDFENLRSPIDRAGDRITKKPFGIKVSPQNSPVQPERFSGFHTGVDLEIFPEELNKDVAVHALCTGPLKQKQSASGYGGVVVQQCDLQNQTVAVIYGHMALSSVKTTVGRDINAGDVIGNLGADKSKDAGGERKHLHLGIYKGTQIDIKGYVANENELQNWIDPKPILVSL